MERIFELEHYNGFENGTDKRMKRIQEFTGCQGEIRSMF